MLKKNLPIVIIFLLLLISVITYFYTNSKGTLSSKVADFASKDLSDVNRIAVKNHNSYFILYKNEDSWSYNTSFHVKPTIISLCYRIFSQVEIKSPLNKEYSLKVAEKLEHDGTEIKLCNKKKILKHFFIWADSLTRNTYMMMAGQAVPFIVSVPSIDGNFAALFLKDSSFWRDLTLLHYLPGQIKSIQIEQPANPKQSFKLEISKSGKIAMTDFMGKEQKINKDALGAFLYCFKNVSASAFLDNNSELLKAIKMKTPLYTISISDFNGDTKNFKIFSKEKDNFSSTKKENNFDKNFCYVLINNKDLAIVKYVAIDPVTRDLEFFLQK